MTSHTPVFNHKSSTIASATSGTPFITLSNWLFVTAGFVLIMVVLGGFTRLTGSGLSMVDWRPVTGFLPPLNEGQWQGVFDLYKLSPQYHKVNFGMSLSEFKGIFWLEFVHRLVGRLIGFIFLIPLLYSLLKKELRPWSIKILGIWVLGGLQGAMGWYMVKSGLVDDPWVSPFRLCAHLLLAFLTGSLLFWSGLVLRSQNNRKATNTSRFFQSLKDPWTLLALTLLVLTICYGAFVAGMKAGLIYNTFPLMGETFMPSEILFHSPWYENFFFNPATVQFTHRVLALLTLGMLWGYGFKRLKGVLSSLEKKWIMGLLGWSLVQVSLGISTLVLYVPYDLAVAHQAGALILLTFFLGSLYYKTP
tara:strand:+ start:205 stop:1290 length:1086 start_codon:yes stop_codon:yes gene_type:complete